MRSARTALVLACDDNFVPYASVVARRAVMLSAAAFPVIILSDRVTEENKKLAKAFCPRISFVEAGSYLDGKNLPTTKAFTRAAFLRMFVDEILVEFDRVAYIDSDVTPLIDISLLLAQVPTASPVIATYDLPQCTDPFLYSRLPLSKNAGYLQSGVLVLDIKALGEERIFKDAIRFALNNSEVYKLVDQDAINCALQGRWQVLDWRWNVLRSLVGNTPKPYYLRHMNGPKPWSPIKAHEPALIARWRADLQDSPWPQKYLAPDRSLNRFAKQLRPIIRTIEAPLKYALRGEFRLEADDTRERRAADRRYFNSRRL